MKLLTAEYRANREGGRYRIDTAQRLRIEEYHGPVGLDELKSVLHSMTSDPCWSPSFNGLIDFTDATPELTANEILRLALILRQEHNRSTGWLIFVVPNSTVHGMVRMLSYWSRNSDRLRIFEDRKQADSWAILNRDHVPPRFRDALPEEESSPWREVV